jgi:hypothetical protein
MALASVRRKPVGEVEQVFVIIKDEKDRGF